MKTKPAAATGTICNPELFEFPAVKKRPVRASFTGGEVTSDGGIALLRQADRRLGLTKALAQVLPDSRDPRRVDHPLLTLIRQRIYGLAQGDEDLNDHDTLRHDLAWQTAVERDQALASSPTLCRLENRADRARAWAMHAVRVNQFIASFARPPAELILDFDATDDRVHGQQEGRFFHGYYGGYCFLPLYVFCGEQLWVSYLRPANGDAARHAWAVLKLLVGRLRQAWPQVKLIFRGDSGFCRWRLLRWCEDHGVRYVAGLAKNARVLKLAEPLMEQARKEFASLQIKQRHFGEVESWDKKRRVLVKAEHTAQGSNPRFVVTTLEGPAQFIYDERYCARGEMENRIKEQQLGLFADRTSGHGWWANQFRLLLSSGAHVLMERLRALALAGTELARAQVNTIRLKLLKIGAVVLRNTRRVRLLLSSSYPYQALFGQVVKALGSG
jgi:Transposase DDE domain group 1